MIRESRMTAYIGINCVMSPMPIIDRQHYIDFQQAISNKGIEFTRAELQEPREIAVVRERPTQLEIRVMALTPSPVGQLLIAALHPASLDMFAKEAEAIVSAFDSTWSVRQRQIMSSDATFRDLFESSTEHAFKELWEMHLGQTPDSLAALERPVLGGGLRFVMPQQPGDPEPVQIEVKIESFLRDTKKIYIETQFTWPQPMLPGKPLELLDRLEQIDSYVANKIVSFIMGESQ